MNVNEKERKRMRAARIKRRGEREKGKENKRE